MRSRFSAFAVGDIAYLLFSWHPVTRPHHFSLDPDTRWTHLEILETARGGALDAEGTVSFVAHSERRGQPATQGEVSRFSRQDGRWVYVSPVGLATP